MPFLSLPSSLRVPCPNGLQVCVCDWPIHLNEWINNIEKILLWSQAHLNLILFGYRRESIKDKAKAAIRTSTKNYKSNRPILGVREERTIDSEVRKGDFHFDWVCVPCTLFCYCVFGYLIGGEQLYVVGLNLSERQGSRKNKLHRWWRDYTDDSTKLLGAS